MSEGRRKEVNCMLEVPIKRETSEALGEIIYRMIEVLSDAQMGDGGWKMVDGMVEGGAKE